MPLNPLNHHYAMENPPSVYDEEALTALELAGRTTAKVNETVKAFNALEQGTNEAIESQNNTIGRAITELNVAMPLKVKEEFQSNVDNGTFENMVDEYAGNLSYRVNQLLGSLQTGSTSSDAELIDMRTDASGHVHPNAGQMTRFLHSSVLDKVTYETSFYENSYIMATGGQAVIVDTTLMGKFGRSGYINVREYQGCNLIVYGAFVDGAGCAVYDENFACIGSVTPNTNPEIKNTGYDEGNAIRPAKIYIPENGCLLRFSIFPKISTDIADYPIYAVKAAKAIDTLASIRNELFEIVPLGTITTGKGIKGNSGTLGTLAKFECTDFIDISKYAGGVLFVTMECTGWAGSAFYDRNKNYICGMSDGEDAHIKYKLRVPLNAQYIRITGVTGRLPALEIRAGSDIYTNDTPTPFHYHLIDKVLCIGDSLTRGAYYHPDYNGSAVAKNYPYFLKKMSGWDITNGGKSGSYPSEWLNNQATTIDPNWATNYDTYLIWFGTNNGLPELTETDTGTETDYYHRIINEIVTKNPSANIFVGTIFATSGDMDISVCNTVIKNLPLYYPNVRAVIDFNDPSLHNDVTHPFGNTVHFGVVGNLNVAKTWFDQINESVKNYEMLYENP